LRSPLAHSVIGKGGTLHILDSALDHFNNAQDDPNDAFLKEIGLPLGDDALVRAYLSCAQSMPYDEGRCEDARQKLLRGEVGRLAQIGVEIGARDGLEPPILDCTLAICLELSLTCQYTSFLAEPAANFANVCDIGDAAKKAHGAWKRFRSSTTPRDEELEQLAGKTASDADTLLTAELPSMGLNECSHMASALQTTTKLCSVGSGGSGSDMMSGFEWMNLDHVLEASRFGNQQITKALPHLKKTLFYADLVVGPWWPFVSDSSEWRYERPTREISSHSQLSELPEMLELLTGRVRDLKDIHHGLELGSILLIVSAFLALYTMRKSSRTVRERMLLLELAEELQRK